MRAVRAAYERVLLNLIREYLKRLRFLVTTFIIKSDVFRPVGPGGGAFQWWVSAQVLPLCTVFCGLRWAPDCRTALLVFLNAI